MAQYFWKAVYKDEGTLCQYNDDGSENKYSDIDRTKLVRFVLLQVNKGVPVLTVHFDRPDQRLICRRRKAIHFGVVIGGQGMKGQVKRKETVWIVGWQETIETVNFQSISFIFEDGSIEVRPRFDVNSQWAYPIGKLLPEEKG